MVNHKKLLFSVFAILIAATTVLAFQSLEPSTPTNIYNSREFSKKEIFYNSDGRKIQGFLYKPAGENLPAILYLHGGDTGFDAGGYVEEIKKRGYAVLAINYPGEGKSEGMHGEPMQENQAAIDAVSYLKNLPYGNPNKIGILGSSHGAGIGLMAIETLNVAAAVDAFGAVDAFEICYYWVENGIKGVTKADCDALSSEYVTARSPIFGVNKINTPLLIVHGAKDKTVPIQQSDRLAAKLQKLGKTYLYKKYPNSPHGFIYTKTAESLSANKEIFAWFEKYLKTK